MSPLRSEISFPSLSKTEQVCERRGDKNAQYVKYEDIPKNFVAAIISIEDKKFYQHNGVDLKGLVRAVKATVMSKLKKSQGGTQGGSTITMQLAKLIYMQPKQTWQYKVKQMFLAWELEKRYSKDKIMEFYLNNVYFANGYYGIDAACHGYFNCELKDLDVSQTAYLCAIPNRPSNYDPVTHPDNTITRRLQNNTVVAAIISNMGLLAMKRKAVEVCVTTVGGGYCRMAMVAPTDMCSAESSPGISFSVTLQRPEMESLHIGGDSGEEADLGTVLQGDAVYPQLLEEECKG